MPDIFYPLRAFGSMYLGLGRDRYTQTRFHNDVHTAMIIKGEEWVDTSNAQKLDLYKTTAHLKIVIDRKALMKANGIYKHFKLVKGLDGKPVKQCVENSPFIERIENPNFLQDGNSYAVQSSVQMSVFGNNVQYIPKGPLTKQPKIMWNLPAEHVTMELTGKLYKQIRIEDVIAYYKLNGVENGETEIFETKDVLHFRDVTADNPLFGESRITGLKMPISNLRGAEGFKNRIINANSMLGILSSEVTQGLAATPLTDKEQKKIDKAFQARYGMQEGKADILQTQANVKWQPMSYPMKDLRLVEEVTESFKAIIDAYGLNVNIFSVSRQSTYENLKQGIILAYQDTIIPEGQAEGMMYTKYFNMDGKTEWIERCYDHLDILKQDTSESMKRKSESAAVLLQNGVPAENVSLITELDLGKVKAIQQATPPTGNPNQ